MSAVLLLPIVAILLLGPVIAGGYLAYRLSRRSEAGQTEGAGSA
jgi:hypothetical protein